MKLRSQTLPFLALLLAVSPRNSLNAQTPASGGITGVVTDPNDAVVPHAIVELQNNAKATTQKTITNADGLYLFSFLLPDSYRLTFTHQDFEVASRKVDVPLGPPVTLNVRLKIAVARTTIEVAVEAPLVKAENGDVSATLTRQQISQAIQGTIAPTLCRLRLARL